MVSVSTNFCGETLDIQLPIWFAILPFIEIL